MALKEQLIQAKAAGLGLGWVPCSKLGWGPLGFAVCKEAGPEMDILRAELERTQAALAGIHGSTD